MRLLALLLALLLTLVLASCIDGKEEFWIEANGGGRAEITYDIPATAELPIQSALATACDAGLIELFEGDWLNGLADTLEAMIKEEKK